MEKETLEKNPYVLLGIPYGSDAYTANKALAKKSSEYRKSGKDISPLTAAVNAISKQDLENNIFMIPSEANLFDPPILGLEEYLLLDNTSRGIREDNLDFLEEYTPLGSAAVTPSDSWNSSSDFIDLNDTAGEKIKNYITNLFYTVFGGVIIFGVGSILLQMLLSWLT